MITSQRKTKRDIQFALQRMKEAQSIAHAVINTEGNTEDNTERNTKIKTVRSAFLRLIRQRPDR